MNTKNQNIFNIKVVTVFLISFFTILRYSGLISPYIHGKFYADTEKLDEDIYYTENLQTFVYEIFNFNYLNDYFYFLFYLIVSFIGYYYTYKLLKKFSNISVDNIFLCLLILSGLDSFFLYDVKSSLSQFTQSPSTIVSWALFPLIMYTLLNKNNYLLSLTVFLNLLISIKFGFFPSVMALVYLLIYEKKFTPKILLSFSIFFGVSSYFFIKGDVASSAIYSNKEILNLLINNIEELRDYLFLEQRFIHLFLFFVSCIIYLFIKKNLFQLKKLFDLIFILTLIGILFHVIYIKYIFDSYPDMRILMFTITGNLSFYQFIFIISIVQIIDKLNTSNITKLFFIFFIIYFNWDEVMHINKKISITFILLGLFFYHYQNFFKKNFEIYSKPKYLILILLFYLPILTANFEKFKSKFSYLLFINGNEKFFSTTAGINFLDKSLLKLKKCKNISTAVFYRNSNYTNTKHHFLSLGKYPKKNKENYYL